MKLLRLGACVGLMLVAVERAHAADEVSIDPEFLDPNDKATIEEVAVASQNPVASLISLPFQNNRQILENGKIFNNLLIQPVLPFRLTKDWNLVTRTIIPLLALEDPPPGFDSFGLGDLYELAWILPSIAIPVGMLVALAVTAFGVGIHLPSDAGRIDVTKVAERPPFDQPGVVQTGPGHYEARMVAGIWSFKPSEIRVPAGSTLTFVATSRDIVHGLQVDRHNVIPWSVGILSGTDALLARALFWFYDGLPPTTPTWAILSMVPA